MTPITILTVPITPTMGNTLRYHAFVAFEIAEISTVMFRILDSIGGPLIVQGPQSYPTVLPLLTFDTIALTWEIAGVTGGNHTVTLEMETSAGATPLTAGFRFLGVEEIVP